MATPEPGPGEVRVRLHAIGVNFIEVYFRTGAYKTPLPFTPGGEGSGVVDAVGEGVSSFAPGERAGVLQFHGGHAECALAKADRLLRLPDSVSFEAGTAAMIQGMTAHYLARATYQLKPGDTCLVHAAAGGVGLLLCQIAWRFGARVIGTVSAEEKALLARAAGASEVILYTQQDFVEEGRRLTEGKGFEVIYHGWQDDLREGIRPPQATGNDGSLRAVQWRCCPARPAVSEPEGFRLPHETQPFPRPVLRSARSFANALAMFSAGSPMGH